MYLHSLRYRKETYVTRIVNSSTLSIKLYGAQAIYPMRRYFFKLQNLKIFDGQGQNPTSVIEDLRLHRNILSVQPDLQLQGILLIAVINGYPKKIILKKMILKN